MIEFNAERAYVIADEIRTVVDEHALLASRTDDPLFRGCIRLCRGWWLTYLLGGLHEVPNQTDSDAVADAIAELWGDLENEIVRFAGIAGFERFLVWARDIVPDYEEPIPIRDCTSWILADPDHPEHLAELALVGRAPVLRSPAD
jgi:hypothetical protein